MVIFTKVTKFTLGTAVDTSAYEAWLDAHPTALVSATVIVDGGVDGPVLIVTYRL